LEQIAVAHVYIDTEEKKGNGVIPEKQENNTNRAFVG